MSAPFQLKVRFRRMNRSSAMNDVTHADPEPACDRASHDSERAMPVDTERGTGYQQEEA